MTVIDYVLRDVHEDIRAKVCKRVLGSAGDAFPRVSRKLKWFNEGCLAVHFNLLHRSMMSNTTVQANIEVFLGEHAVERQHDSFTVVCDIDSFQDLLTPPTNAIIDWLDRYESWTYLGPAWHPLAERKCSSRFCNRPRLLLAVLSTYNLQSHGSTVINFCIVSGISITVAPISPD